MIFPMAGDCFCVLAARCLVTFPVADRVGNFRQKNNSAEDGIDGTNGYFRSLKQLSIVKLERKYFTLTYLKIF